MFVNSSNRYVDLKSLAQAAMAAPLPCAGSHGELGIEAVLERLAETTLQANSNSILVI